MYPPIALLASLLYGSASFVVAGPPSPRGNIEVLDTSGHLTHRPDQQQCDPYTTTILVTVAPGQATPTSASTPTPIILSIEPQDTHTPNYTGGYIGNATIENPQNCSNASIYILEDGELKYDRALNTTLSVGPGVPHLNFANNTKSGRVSTYFSIVVKALKIFSKQV